MRTYKQGSKQIHRHTPRDDGSKIQTAAVRLQPHSKRPAGILGPDQPQEKGVMWYGVGEEGAGGDAWMRICR